MAGNSTHLSILGQKNKNQMKFIWCTLNSFGNNKAKRAIRWARNCIFINIINWELLCLLKIYYFFELSSSTFYFELNFASAATNLNYPNL